MDSISPVLPSDLFSMPFLPGSVIIPDRSGGNKARAGATAEALFTKSRLFIFWVFR
jgi:hypothetical protein